MKATQNILFVENILKNVETTAREQRQKAADFIVKNPDFFSELINIAFLVDQKISIRAAWVLEWLCNRNLNLLVPYLTVFVHHIHLVKHDSAVRSIAKICELLAKAYTSKNKNQIKKHLKPQQIEKIIEAGFNWLLTPQKTAVKAYTMETLYLFGLQQNWIHAELAHLISTKIIHQSKGCKARGKKILNSIELPN